MCERDRFSLEMFFQLSVLLLVDLQLASSQKFFYPELRSDLQGYQDFSRCYPDVGKWYLMHRNYYSDPNFGGAAKCVTFERYGSYENFSTPAVYSFGGQGSTKGQVTFDPAPCYTSRNKATFVPFDDSSPQETFYLIYIECQKCTIMRHPYAENGYGCTYWRREDTMNEPADCCDFIYDENCGTTPKYQIYDASCGSNV